MKNKKIIKLLVGAVLVSGGVFGGIYTKDTLAVEANVDKLGTSINKLDGIYNESGEFFNTDYNKVEDFLKNLEKNSKQLENVIIDGFSSKEKSDKLVKELDFQLNTAYSKLEIGKKLNELFNKNVALDKQDSELVANLDVLETLDLDESLTKFNKNSDFYKNVDFYINLALSQKKEQIQAKELLKKVYADGKVVSTNKDSLDSAKEQIEKVKDEEVKKDLLKSLEVSQKQYEKEEAERIAKEKAEKEKAEREAKEQAELARKQAEEAKRQEQASVSNQSQGQSTQAQQNTQVNQNTTPPAVQSAPSYKYTISGYASVTLANSQSYIDNSRYSWISISDIATLGGVALLGHADAAGTWVAGSSVGDIVNVSGQNYKIYNKYIVGYNSQEEWNAIEQCASGEMTVITCTSSAGDTNWVLRMKAM